MGLEVKSNYQLFNIDKRSLDFAGFVMNHRKTFIRKRITKKSKKKSVEIPTKYDYTKCTFFDELLWLVSALGLTSFEIKVLQGYNKKYKGAYSK